MESSMNIRLFHNGSVLVWMSSQRSSVYNMDQLTNMMIENAYEGFSVNFEINVELWAYFEYWGAFSAGTRWPLAWQLCCDNNMREKWGRFL